MLSNQVAKKYGRALFELAVEKGKLQDIQTELTEVVEAIKEHEELNDVIYHPQISRDKKKRLLDELFGSEVSKILLHFLKLLIDKRREKFLESILERYIELANEANEILEVEVKSAFTLSATNKTRLKNKLEQLTGKEVRLEPKVDSNLIGGLVLKIGDKVIDGSLYKHLQVMKDNLNKIEASKLGVN
ncbi:MULTISPECIES: F0F1 ATP synthase subunit delta [unclassified Candidatus Frackibacter]|uniref:F0F1 ATP synthase subunit delta n=1 Tax=unclassified Candidatus Frackibacter TaxID=2648818 RepID=UPI000887E193|nr:MULTISPECIES: F0F1 ATP synthase subunit delta [unclassified Candidatus Frackibacter]SDC10384.1 ATP synthase F1 subcomplex delta subunit [Candidatus Frackibacter sp. WG11]SEM37211.1 ATP synthase F1 subcomplex delta subunit [Candidatus Frackibacter sp. WG12]SFL42601.1 ATP synthase F1 subcomplex delta subunit [Candidatus Frackibacter sp. WG13]